MRYKLAMYDWNGTLANDVQIGFCCVNEIFRTFGPDLEKPTFEDWRIYNGNSNFLDFYHDHGISQLITIEQMRNVWIPLYHSLAVSQKLLLNEGAIELLRFCKRHDLPNVVISSSVDDVEHHLKVTSVHHLFHAVNLRVRYKHVVIRDVVEAFGVLPREAFYVDDTFDGLVSAKEVGVATFGFTGGFNCEDRIRAAEPDHVIHSFSDILKILEEETP